MNKIRLILSVIAVLGLASCSKEDLSQGKTAGTGTPMAVSSASLSTVATKAGMTTTKLTSDGAKIGVFQLPTTGYSVQDLEEYDYSAAATKWDIPSTAVDPAAKYIYLNGNSCTVVGFYPWGAAGITKGTTNANAITLTSQKYLPAQDLCYQSVSSVSNQTTTSSAVIFDGMQHAYSKLTFRISRDATYTGTGDVRLVSVNNPNILTSNTLDLTQVVGGRGTYGMTPATGPVTAGDGTTAMVTIPATTAIPAYVDQSLLMVPVSTNMSALTTTLSFNVDGTILSTTFTGGLTKLQDGQEYIIGILVKGTTLTVSGVWTANWLTDTILNGSETPLTPVVQ
jgi:hypothetical protein